jgi:aspartyl aminopeptidase
LTENNINCVILYDNEEVGSVSHQGAESNLLPSFVERIAALDDYKGIGYHQLLANSFLISADAGHAVRSLLLSHSTSIVHRGWMKTQGK